MGIFAKISNIMDAKKTAKKSARKGQLNTERELAKLYYIGGMSQKNIAEKIGVSAQTVNRWAKEDNWESLRAAKTISRKELVLKMLQKIDQRLEDGDWTPDEMVKAASAIEKLDKSTNAVTVIEVMTAFNKWIRNRAQYDPALTQETVDTITKYQDAYISEILSSAKIDY